MGEVVKIATLRKRRYWVALKRRLLFGEPIKMPTTDEVLKELMEEFAQTKNRPSNP